MVFDDKTVVELMTSIEAEVAKASAELRCAKSDLAQAETRLKFVIAITHHLKSRLDIKE